MKQLFFISLAAFSVVVSSCIKPTLSEPTGAVSGSVSTKEDAKEAWEIEWQKTLLNARKEGRVIVYSAPSGDLRRAFIEEFQKAYPGITVEYVGGQGGEISPKITAQRNAGLFLADLVSHGTSTMLGPLKPYALPIEQFLILPEVKNQQNWKDGKLEFSDRAREVNLVFSNIAKSAMAYNPQLLPPEKAAVLSFWDLTKPEWKGKVLMHDPRIAGAGDGMAWFMYYNPKLGSDFIRALAKNDIQLIRDSRQALEWVGRGKYTLMLAPSDFETKELMDGGLNIKLQGSLKEGTFITAGIGSVIYMDKAPHPNAAKVFLNWLLSKEGQTVWAKATGYVSLRLDVTAKPLIPELVPLPGVQYGKEYTEEGKDQRVDSRKLIAEVFR